MAAAAAIAVPRPARAELPERRPGALLAGGGAVADYELDLDIRAFELDAQKSEVHVDVVAKIVSAASGRVAAVDIFTARVPVASTDGPTVVRGARPGLGERHDQDRRFRRAIDLDKAVRSLGD